MEKWIQKNHVHVSERLKTPAKISSKGVTKLLKTIVVPKYFQPMPANTTSSIYGPDVPDLETVPDAGEMEVSQIKIVQRFFNFMTRMNLWLRLKTQKIPHRQVGHRLFRPTKKSSLEIFNDFN